MACWGTIRDKYALLVNPRYILSGGPGTGKTTTLRVLESRGLTCCSDVARGIIQSRLQAGLSPRPDPPEFALSLLQASIHQYDKAINHGSPMFFDFSIVESLMMMKECELLTDSEVEDQLRTRPYNHTVFFFPPWEAIFIQDSERDQTFHDSVRISNNIRDGYASLGFTLVTLPLSSPEERANLIIEFTSINESKNPQV